MNEKLSVLQALKLRWHYNRFKEPENIRNVALTQIFAGLLTISIQVYLFFSYDRNEKAESHAMVVFGLGICTTIAGIVGCLHNGRRRCTRVLYLSSCSLVMISSAIILFITFCWDFLSAIQRAQNDSVDRPYSSVGSDVQISDELHFWLKCALFLCIIVASLFTLTGLCLMVSFQKQQKAKEGYYPASNLDRELLPM